MENLTLHILFKAFFGAIAFDFVTGVFKSFKKACFAFNSYDAHIKFF